MYKNCSNSSVNPLGSFCLPSMMAWVQCMPHAVLCPDRVKCRPAAASSSFPTVALRLAPLKPGASNLTVRRQFPLPAGGGLDVCVV